MLRSNSALLVVALASFAVAGVIGVGVFLSGAVGVLHDVAAVGRMPVPGGGDVELERGSYGLYFGDLNAPRGKVMGVPSLDIRIVPPDGVADPGFVTVPAKADVYVDGYHTVQVASITVATAGVYHVKVESREQNGGSFSIGRPPVVISAGRNMLRAWPFIGVFTILGLGLGTLWMRGRSRESR